MTTHKVKINGRKQKIRIVGKNETIKSHFLQHLPACNLHKTVCTDFSVEEVLEAIAKGGFSETRSIGDSTAEHAGRMYIEIVSF